MLTLLAASLAACSPAPEPLLATFPSGDGLELSADLYLAHPPEAPFILLFHMAGSSRGEYRPIAARLSNLGFNLLALDQRSGNASSGVANESFARARAAGLPRGYLDALPDMRAAIAWARARHAKGKLLLWGSSYSASMAIKLAGDEPSLCDGVLAFSPGEYFGEMRFIEDSARTLAVPAFVSSARAERGDWQAIYDAIPGSAKASFLPEAAGVHGSPALWPDQEGSGEYWKAVEAFLGRF